MWKCSRDLIKLVTQDSQQKRRLVILVLVLKDPAPESPKGSCYLFRFWTSFSMLLSLERILPGYLSEGTTDCYSSATVKTGDVGGMLALHW